MKYILIEGGIRIDETDALEWIGHHLKGLKYEIIEERNAIVEAAPAEPADPEPEQVIHTEIVEAETPQEAAERPTAAKRRRSDILGDL